MIQIQVNDGQRVELQEVDGRYTFTFTPTKADDTLTLINTSHSPDLILDNRFNYMQLELGDEVTPFEDNTSSVSIMKALIDDYVEAIKLSLKNQVEGLTAQIELTANGILKQFVNEADGLQTSEATIAGKFLREIKRLDDEAVSSAISQSANQIAIGLRDKSGEFQGLRINPGLNHISGQTLIDEATIKAGHIGSVNASTITTGVFNAADGRIINLDVNSLVGNIGQFIQLNLNNINSSINLDGNALTARHNDGSRTILSANGLYHEEKGGVYKTQYITHVQPVSGLNHDSIDNMLWVQLPDIFKGKNFKVYAVLSDAYGMVNEGWYNRSAIQRIVAFVQQDRIDYANARVPLRGYCRCVHMQNFAVANVPVQVTLIATI